MQKTFDVAVIGLGAMGSATLFNLAKRGVSVIGFDQYVPGHDKGSSHGESRIIRLSYFEDPSYVPLLREAYEAWRSFETLDGGASGSLLTVTGIIEAGCPGAEVVSNSLKSSCLHGLAHTEMSGADISRHFPALDLPRDWSGLFQPDGGFLRPEAAITRFVDAAGRRGADVRGNTRIRAIESKPNAVVVHTDDGSIEAGSVVLTAGAWMKDFVPILDRHLTITRQVLGWFPPRTPALFEPGRCPVFILQSEDDHCYGFPDLAGTGVKAASHERGRTLTHADELEAETDAYDETRIAHKLSRFLPDVSGTASRMKTCMYTRTLDGHFIVDRAPDDPRVVVASPCSGHGFKFASLMGMILADMAQGREAEQDISLFRLARFAAA